MNDTMQNIKSLREMTGAGFLDCKNALSENDNNLDASIDYLRKKGLAKANKKASREAKEGAIGLYSTGKMITIIQINTETDFAAKNEVFLNFMDRIGSYSLQLEKKDTSIEEFKATSFDGSSINDQFKEIIAKIGENIILSKFILISNEENYMISSYIHNSYRNNIGKIVTVLKSKVQEINEESETLGKNLCMHIAASKPLALNIEKLDKELIKKEKEIQLDGIKSSGKPENIVEKILEGKMNKFYSESTLMNQQYILDPDNNVSQIIKSFSNTNNFEIIDYNLLILGS